VTLVFTLIGPRQVLADREIALIGSARARCILLFARCHPNLALPANCAGLLRMIQSDHPPNKRCAY
jgi:hypothetical protein